MSTRRVLRLVHFLALAAITIRYVPGDWLPLQRPVLRPLILCGQHSLALFCFGVFLSFAGHFILVEISNRIVVQFLVSAAGIVLMVAAAWAMSWYKATEGRGPGSGPGAVGHAVEESAT